MKKNGVIVGELCGDSQKLLCCKDTCSTVWCDVHRMKNQLLSTIQFVIVVDMGMFTQRGKLEDK